MMLSDNFMEWPDDKKGLLLSTMGTLHWIYEYILEENADGPLLDQIFEALAIKLNCSEEILVEIVHDLWGLVAFYDWHVEISHGAGQFFVNWLLTGEKPQ